MRKSLLLTSLSFLSYLAVSAQKLELLPEVGRQSFITPGVMTCGTYPPVNVASWAAGLRVLYYTSKNHGPFIRAAYSAPCFSIGNDYGVFTSTNDLLQLEAGYQLLSQPFYLGKAGTVKEKGSKGLFLQLRPQVGFSRFLGMDVQSSDPKNYAPNGDGETNNVYGVAGGLDFVFSKGSRPFLNVGFHYTKQLVTGEKSDGAEPFLPVAISPGNRYAFNSGQPANQYSNWLLTVGVPIRL